MTGLVLGALGLGAVALIIRAISGRPEEFKPHVIGFAPPPRTPAKSVEHNTGDPGDDDFSVTVEPKQLPGARLALPPPKPLALPPAKCPACGTPLSNGVSNRCAACGVER